MTDVRTVRRCSLVVLTVLLLTLVGGLATATPAAAATCSRTVGGAFTGDDGRLIGGQVGIIMYDANLNRVLPSNCANGSSNLGYDYYDTINSTQPSNPNACCFALGRDGAAPGSGAESTWSIAGIPSNVAFVSIEAYPKSSDGPANLGFTDYGRYGGAMRRYASVSTSIDVRLPRGTNYGGTNGSVGGRVLQNGAGVAIAAIHAFSRADDRPSPPLGFMSYPGNGNPNGTFVVPQLAGNQNYAISFEFADGRQAWYEHDYGTGLPVPASSSGTYDFTLVNTPGGLRAVIIEQAASGPGGVDLGFAHSISYRGADGSLRQRVGGSLVPLGGQIQGAPDAATWFNGRIDLVARGTDNAVYTRTSVDNGANFGGWVNLGGQTMSSPSIVAWGSGRLDVFAAGTDQQLWHRWSNDGSNWSGWEPLGGVLTGSVDAASWGPGRLDVVGRGSDGQVWHRFFQGGWSSWIPMGGQLAPGSGPAAASPGPNRFDIVVRGTDNRVYHRSYNGAWSNFAWLNGGQTTQDPDAFGVLGRTNVYVTGTNGFIYQTQRPNGSATFASWAAS